MDLLIETIRMEVDGGEPVRHKLPGGGRLYIERPLPFLCLYRMRPNGRDRDTRKLLMGEASFLIASGDQTYHDGLRKIVREVAASLSKRFGAFLLLEMWTSVRNTREEVGPVPGFRILSRPDRPLTRTIETLMHALETVRIQKRGATVEVLRQDVLAPPGLPPILSSDDLLRFPCEILGLEVCPIYRDKDGNLYPTLLWSLKRRVSRALKKGFHSFSVTRTTELPVSYQALGQRIVAPLVSKLDEKLAEVSQTFDVLFQATPVNIESAWLEFREKGCQRMPVFFYRPLPVDPVVVKRRLFTIPTERIEEPTLAQLFREIQISVDRELTMLLDRGTPRFLQGSIQLFGRVDAELLAVAKKVLKQTESAQPNNTAKEVLSAEAFAERARREVSYYRMQDPGFSSQVALLDEMYAGLLVSRGNLLIGSKFRVSSNQAEAFLHHEIGTHALTYFNGLAQPFQQLSLGLPGYDELQEGLAVLGEFLSGGLTPSRLRMLAARVVAVHKLLDGASFVDVFRELHGENGFRQEAAFTITTRVFRGGGLTKDAVYLRGLIRILEYLRGKGDLEVLFVGKIAPHHVKMIRELQARNVLVRPPVLPRYLEDPESGKRLERVRRGVSVFDLLE
jgi:uncharacterized protein (TIGR02421 family)